MTINAPAALLLLLYELVAEEQGVGGDALRGTAQNDILKEYIARGNYIFPPKPSMRLTTDLFAYCAERIPNWNTISISGYHIREAGSTAVQELAFTLANGIAYCDAAVRAGLSPDRFGERLSFFFNAHNDFFQEVAKFRAARRLWARIMRERFGATNPKAQALRFHAQTGGSTLTAQQPQNNVVRVAIQALSAVCGGAQSLHTNSFDEALALPSEHAARLALRTQQILAAEAGATDTADPLGGSYYIEALTDELERRALELIERIDELGGAVAAVEQGFVQDEIEQASFRYQQQVESGERVIVGVNRFHEDDEEPIELHRLDPEAERRQLERTARLRAERNAADAEAAVARVRDAARGDGEHAAAAARRASRALHDRRDLQRAARRVGDVRPAARARMSEALDYHRATNVAARGTDEDEVRTIETKPSVFKDYGDAERAAARDVDRGAAVAGRRGRRPLARTVATTAAGRSTGARTRARARSSRSRRTSRTAGGLYSFDALTPGLVRIGDDVRDAARCRCATRSSCSPASTRGRAGSTWSAAIAMSGGTRGRCSRTCSRSRPPKGSSRGSTRAFVDADVNEALGIDGENEYALALLALGGGGVTLPARIARARGSALDGRRRRRRRGVAAPQGEEPRLDRERSRDAMRRRRSVRDVRGRGRCRARSSPSCCAGRRRRSPPTRRSVVRQLVTVASVEGLEPGIYDAELNLVAPRDERELREAAGFAAMEQEHPRDAAVNVFQLGRSRRDRRAARRPRLPLGAARGGDPRRPPPDRRVHARLGRRRLDVLRRRGVAPARHARVAAADGRDRAAVKRVARISVSPVKGFRLSHPDEVQLGPNGVEENRRFFLVDADGQRLRGSLTPWPVTHPRRLRRSVGAAAHALPRRHDGRGRRASRSGERDPFDVGDDRRHRPHRGGSVAGAAVEARRASPCGSRARTAPAPA